MSRFLRHLASLTFAAVIALGAAGVGVPSAAAADLSIGEAEMEMVRLLNRERAKLGLLPVRVDSRLMAIARERSTDMATKHYFSHTQPDGRNVFDLVIAANIKWYGLAEIIAANNASTLADSAAVARNGWMLSPGHRSVVVSNSYNYVGVGLAIDTVKNRKIWTAVFMKGPDRTGGWLKFNPLPAFSIASSERYRTVKVSWAGGDVQLVVLTSGFRHYQIQVRTNGGAWSWWSYGTTATERSIRVWRGYNYDLRVRACDKAGNCGAWQVQHLKG
ncbi:MAG TPA: CAP domain-containing protein [Vitreimonas sp.]|nr:CAP domain-containing protein [Vitreimonas sp.]